MGTNTRLIPETKNNEIKNRTLLSEAIAIFARGLMPSLLQTCACACTYEPKCFVIEMPQRSISLRVGSDESDAITKNFGAAFEEVKNVEGIFMTYPRNYFDR